MKSLISKRNIIAGFLIINILTGLCSGIISMVLPLFAVSIGASTVEIGVIKGISGIGAIIMVLPSGFLVDHFGSKKLYVLGSIVSAATVILLVFSTMPKLVMLAMAFQGLANSLRFTSLNAAFFDNLKKIGMSKAGWYRGSMSIGLTFLGPLAGGYFLTILDYKSIFYMVAVLTLLPIISLIPLIKNEVNEIKNNETNFNYLEQLKEFKVILKDRILKETILAEGLSTACFSSFLTFIVVYAVNYLRLSPRYASWLVILEGTSYILIVFLCGRLLLIYSNRNLYLTSFGIMMVGLGLIAISKNIVIITIGIIVLGIGTGILNLVTYSNLSEVRSKKGKVSSLLSASTSIGSTFGPMFSGAIGQLFGYRSIFLSYIPLFVIMFLYINASNLNQLKSNSKQKVFD
ncbi:MAG: MFS transporter [Clostridiaceae bacterium]